MPEPLPAPLQHFIFQQEWVFAKTYADTWPHEYIVRDRVDEDLFVQLVRHIREHGYQGHFYCKPITYFDEDGVTYWTMGAPIEETTIINRCPKEKTYEERLKVGTLPELSCSQQVTRLKQKCSTHLLKQSPIKELIIHERECDR